MKQFSMMMTCYESGLNLWDKIKMACSMIFSKKEMVIIRLNNKKFGMQYVNFEYSVHSLNINSVEFDGELDYALLAYAESDMQNMVKAKVVSVKTLNKKQ